MRLLALVNGAEVEAVMDALVLLATACEEAGDISTAKHADAVCDRLRPLRELDDVMAVQWLRNINCGPYRGRGQG